MNLQLGFGFDPILHVVTNLAGLAWENKDSFFNVQVELLHNFGMHTCNLPAVKSLRGRRLRSQDVGTSDSIDLVLCYETQLAFDEA